MTAVPPSTRADDTRRLDALARKPPAAMLVVSDLHLGPGLDPATGRYNRRENFFANGPFIRFLGYHRELAQRGALLVLNGDTIDFLRIARAPAEPAEFRDWSSVLARLGVARTDAELRASVSGGEVDFGLRTDDYKSVWKLTQVARGHPAFFVALAEWVKAGGSVLFVKGNHDLELHWELVRLAIRAEIAGYGVPSSDAVNCVLFCDDAIQLANVYLEHGHQYDGVTQVAGEPILAKEPGQLTLPLGSFVNRYLINPLERLEPFLDNIKPVQDVLWAMLRRRPVRAFGLLFRSRRFLLRAARISRVRDRLRFWIFFGALALPILTGLVISAALFWSPIADWLARVLGRYRFLLSVLGFAAPYIIAAAREIIREIIWQRRWRGVGENAFAAGAWEALRRATDPRAELRYAVVGHTHEQDVQALPLIGAARVLYLNTGTWTPLWSRDRPDRTGRIFHPFVRFVLDDRGAYSHTYLEWSDGRAEPVENVILQPTTF